ncbi:MAG TPA: hypothetical protein VNO50_14680 [Pyrinomonadaceae bacterium]|nr:hypothetical protein [Pyrinomonadaceae bacterium]
MPLLALVFLSFVSLNGVVGQATAARVTAEDRVVIQRRRVVLLRTGRVAREFPHKKRAVVTYPVVSGLRNPDALRRVRAHFDFKNIFDYSLKEYREDAWLEEFGYEVNHNGNSLLDITFRQTGSGAYPDDHEKHFLINLKDGNLVKASEAFAPDKLASLAAAVDRKLQEELRQLTSQNALDKESGPEERESLKQAYENLKFEIANLDEFSVGRKGITFIYDAGFPHVIQALEPAGRYTFTFAELKPYLNPNGPLGQFVR